MHWILPSDFFVLHFQAKHVVGYKKHMHDIRLQ